MLRSLDSALCLFGLWPTDQSRVRDAKERTWDDLPWAEHPVTLRYPLRRLWCRHCGIRTERVGFADPHARLTRRFRQRTIFDKFHVLQHASAALMKSGAKSSFARAPSYARMGGETLAPVAPLKNRARV